MFTPEITDFLNQRGFPAVLGTRNDALIPTLSRVFAVKKEAGDSLSVILPEMLAAKILTNLQQNSRAAVTQANPATSTSYQFKGEYIGHHSSTPEELGFLGENFGAFLQMALTHYGPEPVETLQKKDLGPFITIRLKVEQIFNQTPGPGAGTKVN